MRLALHATTFGWRWLLAGAWEQLSWPSISTERLSHYVESDANINRVCTQNKNEVSRPSLWHDQD
eukprot:scaffold1138_cov128-Cylindrotheca_fusiformis.AAC.42